MNIPNSVLQKENVAMAFGTPISTYLWPNSDAFNAELKKEILRREKAEKGITRSNVGGWHSKPDLLLWEADCTRQLKDRLGAFAVDLTRLVTRLDGPRKINLQMEGWANVSRRGHYNSVHDHPGSTWSGVYYVSRGEPDSDDPCNGKLELIDPRAGVNILGVQQQSALEGRYLVEPMPGLMVMFPSWLKHTVHPFQGLGERISISFNINVQIQQ
jgi:uncharacterized protein (TIGR02466 family)